MTDLVDSMDKVGLVQPIIVSKNGTGYILLAGHRRLEAAKKLKWEKIEADVVDVADEKTDIGRIMAENMARQDLTGFEQAAGFQTMIDLGYTDVEIQAVASASLDEVKAARAISTGKKKVISKMPETASLLEMAGLLEFEGTDAYEGLLDTVGTDNFEHVLERQRQERVRRNKIQTAVKQLEEAGIRQISRESTWDGSNLALGDWRLEKLKLDQNSHAECPGHCATITYEGDIQFRCDRPDLHGVKTQGNKGPKSDEAKALDKLKRENRALWRASTSIRGQFAVAKINLKKPDTRLVKWALDYASAAGIPSFDGHNVNAKGYTESKDGLIRFLAICVWQVEKSIDDWIKYQGATGEPSKHVRSYLAMLIELKYAASDHEKAAVAWKAPKA